MSKTNSRQHIVYFLHIPKTGGTTLRDIINRQYSKTQILQTHTLRQSKNIIKDQDDNSLSKLKIIQGHMKYGLHKEINSNYSYITILREPVSRVLSHYYYAMSQRNNSPYKDGMSIYKYYESGTTPLLINGQTQLISGIKCAVKDPLSYSHELLEIAKENFRNDFLIGGLTERFNESVILMKLLLDWKMPYYSRANTTKVKPQFNDIPKNIINYIENQNQLDLKLYDFAAAKLKKNIKNSEGEIKLLLKRLNTYNKFYGKYFAYQRLQRLFKRTMGIDM